MSEEKDQIIITEETGLVQSAPAYSMTKPEDLASFSNELKKFIEETKLSTVIQGNKYVNVDGWKFAGLNFGLVPMVTDPAPLHQKGDVVTILYHETTIRTQSGSKLVTVPYFASTNPDLIEKYRKDDTKREITTDYFSYKAGCDIINTSNGMKIGSGFGVCSNLELKKVSFEEFAVISMAQTRAIGRGFKNVIGFIMKSAGYAPTPTEEMDTENRQVEIELGVMLDIESAIDGAQSTEELVKIWNGLTAQHQAHREVKSKFSKKKMELKSQGK